MGLFVIHICMLLFLAIKAEYFFFPVLMEGFDDRWGWFQTQVLGKAKLLICRF
jgi:hypothetical protein